MGDIATATATLKARKSLKGKDTIKHENLIEIDVETKDDLLRITKRTQNCSRRK